MGKQGQVIYFVVLSLVGYAVLQSYINLRIGPAMRSAIANDPSLPEADCFAEPYFPHYEYLPPRIDRVLCVFNRVFQVLQRSQPASLVASQFGQAYHIIAAILAYESFKQPTLVSKLGLVFLLLAQLLTAGGTVPLYLAFVAVSRWDNKAVQGKRPSPGQAWAVLLASVLGYVVPSYNLAKEGWSYDSLSIWQIFPIYMIVLVLVLPVVLQPLLRKSTPTIPILLTAAVGLYLSIMAHYRMLASGVDFRDVLMFFKQPEGLTSIVHRFFLMDFLFSVLAISSHLVLSFEGNTAEHKLGYVLVLFFAIQVVGVGGAISALWAYRETIESENIDAWQKRVKARKSK